jgi:hypothetical protein
VSWGGYKFEVLDVDSYRIDQVMVSRLGTAQSAGSGQTIPASPADSAAPTST